STIAGIAGWLGRSGDGIGRRARLIRGASRGGVGDLGHDGLLSDTDRIARRSDLARQMGHFRIAPPRPHRARAGKTGRPTWRRLLSENTSSFREKRGSRAAIRTWITPFSLLLERRVTLTKLRVILG